MTPLERLGAKIADGISLGILKEARVVGVVGSREWPEPERVKRLVEQLHPEAIVISGGARGADSIAVDAARMSGRPTCNLIPSGLEKPEWSAAAQWRNRAIAQLADIVVAFWDGSSPGTKSTIQAALKMGKCVVVLPGQAPEVWELG